MGIGATGAYAGYNSVIQAATKDFNYRAANDGQNMDPTMIDTEQKSAITRQSGETLRMAKDIVNIRNEKQDSFVRSNTDRVEEHMQAMEDKAAKARADRNDAKTEDKAEKKETNAQAKVQEIRAKAETDPIEQHMKVMANRQDPIAEHMRAMTEKANEEAQSTKEPGPNPQAMIDKEPDILVAHRNTMLEKPETSSKAKTARAEETQRKETKAERKSTEERRDIDYYEKRSQEIRNRYASGMREENRGPGKSMNHSA